MFWRAGLALLLRVQTAKAEPASSPSAAIPLPGVREKISFFWEAWPSSSGGPIWPVPGFNPGWRIFSLTLAKIGALSFGGAFTIIPLIQYEVVERFQWVTTKEFVDGIALGQVTPGPISITATFLGYKLAGFWGAIVGTLAIYFPSFFIVILLIPQYDRLRGWVSVRRVQRGILASFVAMLGLVFYNFARTTFVDIPSVIFTVGAFIALHQEGRPGLHPRSRRGPFDSGLQLLTFGDGPGDSGRRPVEKRDFSSPGNFSSGSHADGDGLLWGGVRNWRI